MGEPQTFGLSSPHGLYQKLRMVLHSKQLAHPLSIEGSFPDVFLCMSRPWRQGEHAMLAGGSVEAQGKDLPIIRIVCCPLADVWWQGNLHWDDIKRADNPTAVLQGPTCGQDRYYILCQKPKPSRPLQHSSLQSENCTEAMSLLL